MPGALFVDAVLPGCERITQSMSRRSTGARPGLPRTHDADLGRGDHRARLARGAPGVFRARHKRSDPGRFVPVCFETHNGHRDCVSHSAHRSVARLLSHRGTYGTTVGSWLADDITHVLMIETAAWCLARTGVFFGVRRAHGQGRTKEHRNDANKVFDVPRSRHERGEPLHVLRTSSIVMDERRWVARVSCRRLGPRDPAEDWCSMVLGGVQYVARSLVCQLGCNARHPPF